MKFWRKVDGEPFDGTRCTVCGGLSYRCWLLPIEREGCWRCAMDGRQDEARGVKSPQEAVRVRWTMRYPVWWLDILTLWQVSWGHHMEVVK